VLQEEKAVSPPITLANKKGQSDSKRDTPQFEPKKHFQSSLYQRTSSVDSSKKASPETRFKKNQSMGSLYLNSELSLEVNKWGNADKDKLIRELQGKVRELIEERARHSEGERQRMDEAKQLQSRLREKESNIEDLKKMVQSLEY